MRVFALVSSPGKKADDWRYDSCVITVFSPRVLQRAASERELLRGSDTKCPTPLAKMPRMNIKIRRKIDMLKRVARYCLKFPIPTGATRALAALATLLAAIQAIEKAASMQIGGRDRSAGNVQNREAIARELRNMLGGLNRIARALDADFPGMRIKFRLPRTRSYPALETYARVCIQIVEEMEAVFIDYGMPPTFVTELRAQVESFGEATALKWSGKLTQVEGTSAMATHAERGLDAARMLDACMQNWYRKDPAMLAAWRHARHIERSAPSKTVVPKPTFGELPPATHDF